MSLEGKPLTLTDLLRTIYEARFTGAVEIHFRNGRPQLYSVDKPRRIQILPDIPPRSSSSSPGDRRRNPPDKTKRP